jgi:hypothetical protein
MRSSTHSMFQKHGINLKNPLSYGYKFTFGIACLLLLGSLVPLKSQELSLNKPTAKVSVPYSGFRVYFSDVQILKRKGEQAKFRCQLVNTGRFELNFTNLRSFREKLLLTYDPSAHAQGFSKVPDNLLRCLFEQNIVVKVGESVEVKLNCLLPENTPPVQEDNKSQTVQPTKAPDKLPTKTKPSEPSVADEGGCVDLYIDSVQVLSISKKYMLIEFTVMNRGSRAAPLFGTRRSSDDNVAINFFFSGTTRLTRGALVAGGMFLENGLKETQGLLAPMKPYRQQYKLPLDKKTPFSTVLLLQIDCFDSLSQECDETNNVKALKPNW